MKRLFPLALLLASTLSLAAEKPLVVNGTTIPAARIEAAVKSMQSQGAKDNPELRNMVKQKLVMDELLQQEATRRSLDKSEAFQQQMAAARQQLLAQMLVAEWSKANPVDDKTLKAEYERIKAQLSGNEYHVRHIMLASETDAKAVLDRLAKGEKFDKLAKEKSTDKGSAAQGGLLGWVPASQFPPSFTDALKKLGKGQMSPAPVKTEAGWHIIRVEDLRPIKVPSFNEAKQGLTRQIQGKKFDEFLNQLRTKAKIEQ